MTGSVLSKGTRIPEPNPVSSASLMGLLHIVQNFQSRRKRDPSWRGVGTSRTGRESEAWKALRGDLGTSVPNLRLRLRFILISEKIKVISSQGFLTLLWRDIGSDPIECRGVVSFRGSWEGEETSGISTLVVSQS